MFIAGKDRLINHDCPWFYVTARGEKSLPSFPAISKKIYSRRVIRDRILVTIKTRRTSEVLSFETSEKSDIPRRSNKISSLRYIHSRITSCNSSQIKNKNYIITEKRISLLGNNRNKKYGENRTIQYSRGDDRGEFTDSIISLRSMADLLRPIAAKSIVLYYAAVATRVSRRYLIFVTRI